MRSPSAPPKLTHTRLLPASCFLLACSAEEGDGAHPTVWPHPGLVRSRVQERHAPAAQVRYTHLHATPPPLPLILVSFVVVVVVRPSTCDEALLSPRKQQALLRKGKGGGAACTKEKSATGHGSHKDGRRAGSGKRRAAPRRKRAGRGHYASESDDDSGECDTDTARTDALTVQLFPLTIIIRLILFISFFLVPVQPTESSSEEEADVTDSSASDSESEEESERVPSPPLCRNRSSCLLRISQTLSPHTNTVPGCEEQARRLCVGAAGGAVVGHLPLL